MTVNDAGFAQIVRGHFERDFIASENADVVLAHFATGVGNDGVAVVEGDAESGIGQDFSDEATHFDEFFFSHVFSLYGSNRIHGRRQAGGAWDADRPKAYIASVDAFYERIGGRCREEEVHCNMGGWK